MEKARAKRACGINCVWEDALANYIVSYDLNGPRPTHAELDAHIHKASGHYGRVLETVWYVGTDWSLVELHDHLKSILRPEDRLLVVQASDATWYNLLVRTDSLRGAWERHR